MKWPHGYRRQRLDPQPAPPNPPDVLHLDDFIVGADAIARITREAASMAALPDPEDLLVMWAKQYYAGGGDFFAYQIGLYVAEDLRLNGKLRDGG